jgi:integrase/recombinase XerD
MTAPHRDLEQNGGGWCGPCHRLRRHLDPVRIDKLVQTYVQQLGFGPGYAAHSMRATFITTALENGAKLEDVQRTVGHADPATTQLYDRRRFLPTKSAALMVDYGRDGET